MSALRVLLLGTLAAVALLGADADDEAAAEFERTPPRLAFVDGDVSFLRPGAEDWAPARANLALASGDRLYTGEGANLELQVGARAFLRAGERTELGVESHEPDFLQLRVGAGLASLDLRSLPAGHTIELDTPNAAFTIEEAGYYRLDVDGDATTLTCRRGGSATLATPGGGPLVVGASEQVVVTDGDAESYAAPELDDWDLWNQRRTDGQLDSLSARYVGSDVYGASDLDQYGSWRTVAPYGPIWIPSTVRVGWAPYGFGRWIWDPHFGWTWLDDAPWGWAPFHYGRWVQVIGRWAWAPGPYGPRLYYAPALVAFYGGARTHVGWVPLGWGEPCLPWWGPRRWIGQPHWLGWSGPRSAGDAHQNAKLPGGVIAVPGAAFGTKPVDRIRIQNVGLAGLRPVRGALPIERGALSLVGGDERAFAPPKSVVERSVYSPRVKDASGLRAPALGTGVEPYQPLPRPPFGTGPGLERRTPEPPPRFEGPKAPRVVEPKAPKLPKTPKPGKIEKLPGEPANRVYPGRAAPAPAPVPATPGLRPSPGLR
jgi:hypothetical protein